MRSIVPLAVTVAAMAATPAAAAAPAGAAALRELEGTVVSVADAVVVTQPSSRPARGERWYQPLS